MLYDSYIAKRRLKIAGIYREPGQLAPEASTWLRVDNFLHTGYLGAVKLSEDELRAAVAEFCPDDLAQVLELAGVPEDIDLVGPRRTPRKRRAVVTELPVLTPTKDAEGS